MQEKVNPMPEVVAALISNNGNGPPETETKSEAEQHREELAQTSSGVQAAYEFLGRKRVTLWADFLITDHHGRLRAARWLAKEMAGVEEVLRERSEE